MLHYLRPPSRVFVSGNAERERDGYCDSRSLHGDMCLLQAGKIKKKSSLWPWLADSKFSGKGVM